MDNLDYAFVEVMERTMKLSVFAAALAMPIAASANAAPAPRTAASGQIDTCELHIFPTNEIIDSSNSYNDSDHGLAGVLIGGLLSSAQSGGTGKLKVPALEQMEAYLPPAAQIEELKIAGVLSVLKLAADTKIVEEVPLPRAYQKPSDPALLPAYTEYMTALKKSRAIKPSTSTCYRELIIVSLSVAKNLGTLKITSEFVYRTFDAQYVETHLYDGENSVPKPDRFPAQPGVSEAEAEAALKEAFRANFVTWVARRVKT
ncbi:MAG: hypothetical protein ACOY4B_10235 [Pseudomonadota bacterium]